MNIRGYCDDDFEQVWNLHELALKSAGAFLHGHGPWDDDLKDIHSNYLKNRGAFLVLELQDGVHSRIIAMGALRRMTEGREEIKRMRVHPDYQGQGLGKLMLQNLEEIAKVFGYQSLQLDTTILQKAAIGLYSKFGYKEIRRDSIGGIEKIFFEKIISLE